MTRAMTGMMEMARRMGGDPMKGMVRIMEMTVASTRSTVARPRQRGEVGSPCRESIALRGVRVLVIMLALAGVAAGDPAKDPFDAMGVQRPAEPFSAPDVGFRSLEGWVVRVRELRGRAVLLGFFTTS